TLHYCSRSIRITLEGLGVFSNILSFMSLEMQISSERTLRVRIFFKFLPRIRGNVVGRFGLFSHWKIPIFFTFLPRESGKSVSLGTSPSGFLPRESVFTFFPRVPIFFEFLPRESRKCCVIFECVGDVC
ncbi:hypothetical protein L9F63_015405, partial [Diploptera punctata]